MKATAATAAATAALVLFAVTLRPADAHARWSCPAPRSPDTGIKARPA